MTVHFLTSSPWRLSGYVLIPYVIETISGSRETLTPNTTQQSRWKAKHGLHILLLGLLQNLRSLFPEKSLHTEGTSSWWKQPTKTKLLLHLCVPNWDLLCWILLLSSPTANIIKDVYPFSFFSLTCLAISLSLYENWMQEEAVEWMHAMSVKT